jgi:prefoldin subunit 5
VTPVSIPPDPYQRALKELRLASEELREAKDRIKRLEAAGDEAIYPLEYAARVRIWTKAKEVKL